MEVVDSPAVDSVGGISPALSDFPAEAPRLLAAVSPRVADGDLTSLRLRKVIASLSRRDDDHNRQGSRGEGSETHRERVAIGPSREQMATSVRPAQVVGGDPSSQTLDLR